VHCEVFHFKTYLELRTEVSHAHLWKKVRYVPTNEEVGNMLGMNPEKFRIEGSERLEEEARRSSEPGTRPAWALGETVSSHGAHLKEWYKQEEALSGGMSPLIQSQSKEVPDQIDLGDGVLTTRGGSGGARMGDERTDEQDEVEDYHQYPPHLQHLQHSKQKIKSEMQDESDTGGSPTMAPAFATGVPEVVAGGDLEDLVGYFQRSSTKGQTNRWSEVNGRRFHVRGLKYMSDKKKLASEESTFELVNVDLFATGSRNEHIAEWKFSTYQKARRNAERSGVPAPFMLIINWLIPGEPMYNQVNYFELKDEKRDPEYERLLQHFLTGPNDAFRDKRFKLIPSVEEGPWIVKQGVGKTPAILGSKLKQTYFRGDGYLEIDIDVGSSQIAAQVLKMCKNASEQLVIDLAFCIEGKKEEELPERILGALRLHYISMRKLEKQGDPITGKPLALP